MLRAHQAAFFAEESVVFVSSVGRLIYPATVEGETD